VLLLGDIKTTKTLLCFPMVRPPCRRLGSARLARATLFLTCTKGRATGSAREHDV
jgi:hypothetical protein